MIRTITKQEPVDYIESVVCDVCGKSYQYEGGDYMEAQEFTHIKFTGGFGSVFGDMSTFECDICQRCLKEKLGKWIRFVPDPEDEWDDEDSEYLGADTNMEEEEGKASG